MKSLMPRLLPLALLLTGCANPGIVQISPDTYQLSRSSAAGAFANTSKLKASVISEANLFAQNQGKVAVPVSLNEKRPAVGFPSCDLTFTIMTQAEYERQKEARIKEWNSLTPAQRMEYTLRGQEMNSYDQRTRAMLQPVNVNVNGNVSHTINGSIGVYPY